MRKVVLLALAAAGLAQSHHRHTNEALLGVVRAGSGDKVVVAKVLEGSPAEAAGLAAGDELLQIDGKDIAKPTDVDAALKGLRPGEEVPIEYRRGKKKGKTKAKLADRKDYRGEFLKPRRRGETGFEAPEWFVFAWAHAPKGKEPTRESARGKVVVFHAFQSW